MPIFNPLIPVDSGAIQVWSEVWRADRQGQLLEDISEYVLDGIVDFDRNRAITMGLRISFSRGDILQEFVDFIAPFLFIEYADGTVISSQLGLYGFEIPDKEVWPEGTPLFIEGKDLTWLLSLAATRTTYTIPKNQRYTDSLAALLETCGIFYYDLPTETRKWQYKLSFPPTTNKLEIAYHITSAMGWYPIYPRLNGKLTSNPIVLVKDMNPFATYTEDELLTAPRVRPVQRAMPNVIIVTKDNPTGVPIIRTRINDDVDSPTSTVNTGVEITYVVNNPDFESSNEVGLLADMLREQFKSVYNTIEFEVLPDPTLEGMQAVELIYATDEDDLTGKYAVQAWSLALNEQAVLRMTVSQVIKGVG